MSVRFIACSALLCVLGSGRTFAQAPPLLVELESIEIDAKDPGKARLTYATQSVQKLVAVPFPPNTFRVPSDLSVRYGRNWSVRVQEFKPLSASADALAQLRTATKGTLVRVLIEGEEKPLTGHVEAIDKKQLTIRDAENKISFIPLKDLKSIQIEEPAQIEGTTNTMVFERIPPIAGRFEVSFSVSLLRPLRFQHQLRFDASKSTHQLDTRAFLENMTAVQWTNPVTVTLLDDKVAAWRGVIDHPVLPGQTTSTRRTSKPIDLSSSFEAEVVADKKDTIQFHWQLASSTKHPTAIGGPVSTQSPLGRLRELGNLSIDANTKIAKLSIDYSAVEDATTIETKAGKITTKDHLLAMAGVWLDHCQSHRTNVTIIERTGRDREIRFHTGSANEIRVRGSSRSQEQKITVKGKASATIPVAVAPKKANQTDGRALSATRIQQLAGATTVRTLQDQAKQLADLIDALEQLGSARSRILATGISTKEDVFLALDLGADPKLLDQFDQLQQTLTSLANELPAAAATTKLP
ncbi:MAG: hypothetical protein AAGG44_10130 [Planctomycetota bacterium]